MCESILLVQVLRAALVVFYFVPLEEIPLPLAAASLLLVCVDLLHDAADLQFPFVVTPLFVLGGLESLLSILLLYGRCLHCFLLQPSLLRFCWKFEDYLRPHDERQLYLYGVEGPGNACPTGTQLLACRLSLSFLKLPSFAVDIPSVGGTCDYTLTLKSVI